MGEGLMTGLGECCPFVLNSNVQSDTKKCQATGGCFGATTGAGAAGAASAGAGGASASAHKRSKIRARPCMMRAFLGGKGAHHRGFVSTGARACALGEGGGEAYPYKDPCFHVLKHLGFKGLAFRGACPITLPQLETLLLTLVILPTVIPVTEVGILEVKLFGVWVWLFWYKRTGDSPDCHLSNRSRDSGGEIFWGLGLVVLVQDAKSDEPPPHGVSPGCHGRACDPG